MTGLLGFRTTSYGSLQQQHHQMPSNGPPQNFILLRKHPRMSLSASRDKERFLPFLFRHLSQRNIAMLIFVLTTFAFCITGFFTINRGFSSPCFPLTQLFFTTCLLSHSFFTLFVFVITHCCYNS